MGELQYAVIGRSETYPTLYHMNQTRPHAERLRQRREAAIKRPCFVVAMEAWAANPLTALQEAEAARSHAEGSASRAEQIRYPAPGRRP
jgi:hypothetical protein